MACSDLESLFLFRLRLSTCLKWKYGNHALNTTVRMGRMHKLDDYLPTALICVFSTKCIGAFFTSPLGNEFTNSLNSLNHATFCKIKILF